MNIITTIAQARAARARLGDWGLVPTMGALHAGHINLVALAKAECVHVTVSLFVNPTQFGANEDFDRYPRDLARDLDLLRDARVDCVFTPSVETLYPPSFATHITLGPIADRWEGAVRPGHFSGVALVLTKLFHIWQPQRAYFGQKDAQQCLVIRKLVKDLNFPIDIRIGATVREADGLALSSRNVYLNAEQRAAAPSLFRALKAAEAAYHAGERRGEALRAIAQDVLKSASIRSIDYICVADITTLEALEHVNSPALLAIAVRLGKTQLIDNCVLGGSL